MADNSCSSWCVCCCKVGGGIIDKLDMAIERVKVASKISLDYYGTPLCLGYSGGKDSDCALHVLELANVPFMVEHSHTGVDAPETYRHIKRVFRRLEANGVHCEYSYGHYKGQKVTLFTLIPLKGIAPTRMIRYCCQVLKESYKPNGVLATGVRASESRTRKDYKDFIVPASRKADMRTYTTEHAKGVFADSENVAEAMGKDKKERTVYDCVMVDAAKRNKKMMVNPIVDWDDTDLWEFINAEHVDVNPLYERGWTRCGCVGCPLASAKKQRDELAEYPMYALNYLKAFDRMIQNMRAKHPDRYVNCSAEDIFAWFVGIKKTNNVDLFPDPLRLKVFEQIFGKEDFILSDLVRYPNLTKELRNRK